MAIISSIPGLAESLNAIQQGSRDGAVNEDGSVRTFVTLPFDQELRVVITEAAVRNSHAGNPGIAYVMEVVEPTEFDSGKVWDNLYFTGHPFQGQRLAVLMASAGAQGDSLEEVAERIVGGKLVIALQRNEQDDRYPKVRWMNIDQGQALRQGLKPKAGSAPTVNPQVAALIQQQQSAAQEATPPTAPAPVPPAPPTAPSPTPTPGPGMTGTYVRLPGQ